MTVEFYIGVGDIILRGDRHYRVKRIETVTTGPDAGKRDLLTVEPVERRVRAIWEVLKPTEVD